MIRSLPTPFIRSSATAECQPRFFAWRIQIMMELSLWTRWSTLSCTSVNQGKNEWQIQFWRLECKCYYYIGTYVPIRRGIEKIRIGTNYNAKFWKSCLGLSAATKVKLLFDEYIKTLRIFSLPKAIEKNWRQSRKYLCNSYSIAPIWTFSFIDMAKIICMTWRPTASWETFIC